MSHIRMLNNKITPKLPAALLSFFTVFSCTLGHPVTSQMQTGALAPEASSPPSHTPPKQEREINYQALIPLVEQAIANFNHFASCQNGVLILGLTDCGKTTGINYLRGLPMHAVSAPMPTGSSLPPALTVEKEEEKENEHFGFEFIPTAEDEQEEEEKDTGRKVVEVNMDAIDKQQRQTIHIGEIGHFGSKTKVPAPFPCLKSNLTYIDCPGFEDERSKEMKLATNIATNLLLCRVPVKAIALCIEERLIGATNGAVLTSTLGILKDMFKPGYLKQSFPALYFICTKPDKCRNRKLFYSELLATHNNVTAALQQKAYEREAKRIELEERQALLTALLKQQNLYVLHPLDGGRDAQRIRKAFLASPGINSAALNFIGGFELQSTITNIVSQTAMTAADHLAHVLYGPSKLAEYATKKQQCATDIAAAQQEIEGDRQKLASGELADYHSVEIAKAQKKREEQEKIKEEEKLKKCEAALASKKAAVDYFDGEEEFLIRHYQESETFGDSSKWKHCTFNYSCCRHYPYTDYRLTGLFDAYSDVTWTTKSLSEGKIVFSYSSSGHTYGWFKLFLTYKRKYNEKLQADLKCARKLYSEACVNVVEQKNRVSQRETAITAAQAYIEHEQTKAVETLEDKKQSLTREINLKTATATRWEQDKNNWEAKYQQQQAAINAGRSYLATHQPRIAMAKTLYQHLTLSSVPLSMKKFLQLETAFQEQSHGNTNQIEAEEQKEME